MKFFAIHHGEYRLDKIIDMIGKRKDGIKILDFFISFFIRHIRQYLSEIGPCPIPSEKDLTKVLGYGRREVHRLESIVQRGDKLILCNPIRHIKALYLHTIIIVVMIIHFI